MKPSGHRVIWRLSDSVIVPWGDLVAMAGETRKRNFPDGCRVSSFEFRVSTFDGPTVSASAGVEYHKALEAGSIKTMVTGQQSVSLKKRMRADQKIRCHACSGAASLAIGLPGEACLESCLRLDRAELDLQFSERVAAGRNRWKAARNLGPHHVADEQGPLPSTGAQRIPGSGPELGIVIQEIKQYAGIDGGYHLSGSRSEAPS